MTISTFRGLRGCLRLIPHTHHNIVVATVTATVACGLLASSCRPVETLGCIGSSGATRLADGGSSECIPPPVCPRISYQCSNGAPGSVRLFRIEDAAGMRARPPGSDALGGIGDYVLENDKIVAVIDSPSQPGNFGYLATSGGTILDLATRDGADHLNNIFQTTGILPRDQVRYSRAQEVVDPDGRYVALIVRGGLDGDPFTQVVTRYELRPCDPGIRVRTEVYNRGRTAWAHFLGDAFFWGDRGMTPFAPVQGGGYRTPPLDLLDLDKGWTYYPWMAASSHTTPHASYAVVGCDRPMLEGINDVNISLAGTERRLLVPGDGRAFERMIFPANEAGISRVQSIAMDAHSRLHGDPAAVRVTGQVTVEGSNQPISGADERQASVLIYEPAATGSDPDNVELITPWVEAIPDATGQFSVDLPAGKSYRARVHQHGRAVGASVAFTPTSTNNTLALAVRAPGNLSVTINDSVTNTGIDSEVILTPTGSTTVSSVRGSIHGQFDEASCAPYLGPAHGPSPACNRALARNGQVSFSVPPGTYWVYATAGPSRTLARQQVTLTSGQSQSLQFTLQRLTSPSVFPTGTLSADFHVHGGRSFDTGFSDRDRALTFLSAGVDVIAATDHDVCTSYQDELAALGPDAAQRVVVMPGAELTPLVPYLYPPGSRLPRVIGHFNVWPLTYNPLFARNGAPQDEFNQPGQLIDLVRPMIGEQGVVQLNHPMAGSKVGRDQGYYRVLGISPFRNLPSQDDGTSQGMLFARPSGPSGSQNVAFDTMETLCGVDLLDDLQHRVAWHYTLNQGILRAGTADSDSHSLQVEPLGYPRNVVTVNTTVTNFDRNLFNQAVKDGHFVGTTGPYIEATIEGRSPGISMTERNGFRPSANATLDVVVRAAPWIPVNEVRIVVNGRVVLSLPDARFPNLTISSPTDPFGTDGVERFRGSIPIAMLNLTRDSWVIVEAGLKLPLTVDVDPDGSATADGFPDCLDANNDGVVSCNTNRDQTDDDERRPVRPAETDPRFHVEVISPGMWPFAYTNPFLIDQDGSGNWTAPGVQQ